MVRKQQQRGTQQARNGRPATSGLRRRGRRRRGQRAVLAAAGGRAQGCEVVDGAVIVVRQVSWKGE